MSANGNGGNYAPLKQILTDSESEDDNKLENALHIKASDSNNLDYNSGLQSSKNYSMSDMEEFNTNEKTLETTMDNVSFMQSDRSNMLSYSRRAAFCVSLCFCISTVVIFMWGVPCPTKYRCVNKSDWHDRTTNWEVPYDEIELSGAVQVVNGAIHNTKNLIFIYRGNHMKEDKNNNDNVNGVILIVGSTGKVGWYTRESRIPTDINCHLIDVNRDKQKDCLVSGSEGLLAALNPLSGTYYWYIHKQGKIFSNIATIDFPLVMKRDVDKDRVYDLLTVATVYPNTNHNSLLIISGASGSIIGDPMTLNECVSVKLLMESDPISYICKNGTFKAVRQLDYPVLFRKLVKLDSSVNNSVPASPVAKKVNLSLKKNIGNTREKFTNGPGKLIVENSKECPASCKVTLKLEIERNGTTNVTWEYTANHVYAMKPSTFAFANSIRGFVLKL